MPSSVRDRLTCSFEFVFHFVKQRKYFYDLDAIREPHKVESVKRACRGVSAEGKTNNPQSPFKTVRSFIGYEKMNEKLADGELRNVHPSGKNPGDAWKLSEREENLKEFFNKKGSGGNPGHGIQGSTLGMKEGNHPDGKNPGDFWDTNSLASQENGEFEHDKLYKVLKGCPIHSPLLHPEILKIVSNGEQQDCLLTHTFDRCGCLVPVPSFSLFSKLPLDRLGFLHSKMGFHHQGNAVGQIVESVSENKKSGLCFHGGGQEFCPQKPSRTKHTQNLGEKQDDNLDYSLYDCELTAISHSREIHKIVSLKVECGNIFLEIPSRIEHILRQLGCVCSYYTYAHFALKDYPSDYWSINPKPYKDAHFACFPPKLVEKPLKATCPKQVCVKCGKARDRIVKIVSPADTGTRNVGGRKDGYTTHLKGKW